MKIDLKSETEAWLNSQIAKGRFSSVEEALTAGVGLLQKFEENTQDINDAWVKPYIDEALAEVERGKVRQWKKGTTSCKFTASRL